MYKEGFLDPKLNLMHEIHSEHAEHIETKWC